MRASVLRGGLVAVALTYAWLAGAEAPTVLAKPVPSHLAANVLVNPDLGEHVADQPLAWEFGSAEPGNFEATWSAEGRTAPGSLRLLTHTGKMSGYFTQRVEVTPGDALMVQAWVRMTGGKLLVWLTGSPLLPDGTRLQFDQRYEAQSMKTFFLAPTWIKREYLRGPDPDEWFLVHKAIEIPAGMTALKVGFGSYFGAGEMWIDDIYCGPAQVDVEIKAAAGGEGDGDRITRVEVLAIPGPEIVHDSGPLDGLATWEGVAAGMDAAQDLLVKVSSAGGEYSTARVFPHPRGIQ